MFEIHLGDDLTVAASAINSPLVVLGSAGQGKTVFLLQFILELIRHHQSGLLYDPFGDLAKSVVEHVQSDSLLARITTMSAQEYCTKSSDNLNNGFVMVSGHLIEDGAMVTRPVGQHVIQKALQELKKNSWLVVDEASNFITGEIFEMYVQSTGPHIVLSDQSLICYSAKQRAQLLHVAKQLVIYKTKDIDGGFIEKVRSVPTAKDISVIQQYHYYWIDGKHSTYTKGLWPINVL